MGHGTTTLQLFNKMTPSPAHAHAHDAEKQRIFLIILITLIINKPFEVLIRQARVCRIYLTFDGSSYKSWKNNFFTNQVIYHFNIHKQLPT